MVSNWKWLFLFIFWGIVDAIQLFFPVTGPIDPILGLIMIGMFQLLGIDVLTKTNRLVSILAVFGLDILTFGIAPLWIVDVWYVRRDVRAEEAAARANAEREAAFANQIDTPLYSQDEKGRAVRLPSQDASTRNTGPRTVDGITRPTGRK